MYTTLSSSERKIWRAYPACVQVLEIESALNYSCDEFEKTVSNMNMFLIR